ncbi:MAG: hypothetical protein LBQ93_00855 [Treponema sp.]|nr:hypothetical protein [Treponema sp.]
MKTKKQRAKIFLVLVPHRDVRLVLRNYSAALFKAGFDGAFHFPWVAPLFALSRPFNEDELKHAARVLKDIAGEGKIPVSQAVAVVDFPKKGNSTVIFGPSLNLAIHSETLGASKKIKSVFSPPVTGALICDTGFDYSAIPAPPQLSFRAAAIANMYWRPLRNYAGEQSDTVTGYKWKIGKLCWLAAVKNKECQNKK